MRFHLLLALGATGLLTTIGRDLKLRSAQTTETPAGLIQSSTKGAALNVESRRHNAHKLAAFPAEDSVEIATTEDDYNVSRCALNCNDLLYAWEKPASFTRDQARSFGLVYSSRRAFDVPVIEINATPGSNYAIPEAISVRIRLADDSYVPHLDGSGATEVFFEPEERSTVRIAYLIDANSFPMGVYRYSAEVRFWRVGSYSATEIDGRFIVARRDSTRYGAGWTPAGLQQLKTVGDSALILQDDGSAVYFRKSGSSFIPPTTEHSRLTLEGGGDFTRRYRDGTRIVFNSSGRMIRHVGLFSDTTSLEWGGDTLKTIRDPSSNAITLTYVGGRLSGIADAGGRRDTLLYNAAGDLLSIIDLQDTSTVSFTWSYAHLMSSSTNQVNKTTDYLFDAARKLMRATGPEVLVADSGNGANSSKRPVAVYVSWESTINAVNTIFGSARPFVAPAAAARLVWSPRGFLQTYNIDRTGAPLKVTDPIANRYVEITRDSRARPTTIRNVANNTFDLSYDTMDNVTRIVNNFTGRRDSTTYQTTTIDGFVVTVGPLAVRNNANAPQQSFRYDGTRLTGSWLEARPADSVRYRLRTDGRIDSVIDVAGHVTRYFYASGGRQNLDSVRNAVSVTRYTRDSYGRVEEINRPAGLRAVFKYDARNRMTRQWKAGTDTIKFVYDSLHLRQVIDGKGQTYSFAYSDMGWNTSSADPTGNAQSYLYDLNGNVTKWRNRRGDTIRFWYDAIDRNTKRIARADTATFSHAADDTRLVAKNRHSLDTLLFDIDGRLTSSSTKRASTTYRLEYAYDIAGRKTELTMAAPGSPTTLTKWHHNALGTIDSLTDAGGRVSKFGYNRDLLADTTHFPTAGSVTTRIFSPLSSHAAGGIWYSNASVDLVAGRVMKLDSATRLVATWLSSLDTFRVPDYYPAGRLWSYRVNYTTAPPTCSSELKFGSNCPAGDTINVRTYLYFYDAVGNPAGTLDSVGLANRVFRMYTDWNTLDTLKWDADGNLDTLRYNSAPFNPFRQVFYWDALSRLDTAEIFVSGSPSQIARMRYDAFGRRIWHYSVTDSIRYLWDGDNVVAEIDNSMTVARKFTIAGGLSPFAMTSGDSTYYYLYDESGHVTALMRQDGNLSRTYRMAPFGSGAPPTTGSTGSTRNDYLYWGQYSPPNTGITYMRNRYFVPALRRFISEDPIGLAGGINLYTYADNDPVNRSDPLGLQGHMHCARGHYVNSKDPNALEVVWNCDKWEYLSDSDRSNGDFLSGLREFGSNMISGAASWGSTERENTGPGFGTGALLGLAGFFLPAAGGAGFRITFQSAHAARHLAGTGLTPRAVETAIRAQVLSDLSQASLVGKEFGGRIVVGGQLIEYRAFQFAPGRINIGTYYVPRMY